MATARLNLTTIAILGAVLLSGVSCLSLDIQDGFPCSQTGDCPAPYQCRQVGGKSGCYEHTPDGGLASGGASGAGGRSSIAPDGSAGAGGRGTSDASLEDLAQGSDLAGGAGAGAGTGGTSGAAGSAGVTGAGGKAGGGGLAGSNAGGGGGTSISDGGAGRGDGAAVPDAGSGCGLGMHTCSGECVTDESPDHCGPLCVPCARDFGCAAGVCKTTCATSDDCHPDYFCDATNAACHSAVVSVACGEDHTCAALKDGRVMCWGNNGAGQLGIGTTAAVQGAAQASGLTNAAVVKANEYGSCALTLDGRARCWGNYFGGTQSFQASTTPAPVTMSSGELTGIQILELGFDDGCAVATTGTYCWGQNIDGALGFNSPPDDISPATRLISAGVPSLLGMGYGLQVAAYGTSSVCPWGEGFAKAGDSTGVYPMPQGQCFGLGAQIAQFALGEETTCVRLTSGVVVCWGANGVGQVGTDTGGVGVDPPGVQVPGLDATDVVASIDYACAIPAGNPQSIVCWGHTSAAARVVNPNLASGLRVARLGAGDKAYSMCGIISDGSLRCWDAFGTPQTVPATW
jgi:Regulator of Chromosome Condensation (RCC1) repeat protein